MTETLTRYQQARALAEEFQLRYPQFTWEAQDDSAPSGGEPGVASVVFSDEDTCYGDPFSGQDSRFGCDPTEEYGIRREDAERLAVFNYPSGMICNWTPPR